MLRLEPEYLRSKLFARVYPEVRAMYEEAMGVPLAGVRAMTERLTREEEDPRMAGFNGRRLRR